MNKKTPTKRKKKLGSYPYLSVVVSITIALFVLGSFGMLLIHTQKLGAVIRENLEIQVYLTKSTSENQRIQIQRTLAAKDFVALEGDEARITFVSKEQAAEDFKKETGEDFTEFLGENPLRDLFLVKIRSTHQDTAQLSLIKEDIENIGGVFEAVYVEGLVNSINENTTKIGFVLVGFSLILILVVVILINNTIKLALFSQRFLIRSMQLVGATKAFIQRPFLLRASLHGMLGGAFAIIVLYGGLQYAYGKVENLQSLYNFEAVVLLFALLLLAGGLLGFFSTFRAIRKYMKMSLDDLY